MQPKITILENGLKIVTLTKNISSSNINIAINVGSRKENTELTGMSHFMEHMLFKGTEKRNAKEIASAFDDVGAYINAYTSREITMVTCRSLAENLFFCLDVISDMLCNSNFPEDEIKRELDVIIQEIAASLDNPEDYMFDRFFEEIFPGQSLGKPILGYQEILEKFTKPSFVKFKEEFYAANNMVISVVSKFEHEKIVDEVKKYFGDLKSNPNLLDDKQIIDFSPGDSKINRDCEQARIIIAMPNVSKSDLSLKYHTSIFSMILGGNMSSRLFQSIREEKGLCYEVSSFCDYFEDIGLFGIYAATSHEKLDYCLENIHLECDKLINTITQKELDRSKQQLKTALVLRKEDYLGLAEEMALELSFYKRLISTKEVLDIIDNITIDTLQETAKNIFYSNKRIMTME